MKKRQEDSMSKFKISILSFIEGVSRTLDIGNTYSKKMVYSFNSGREAIQSDWINVGNDIAKAMRSFDE